MICCAVTVVERAKRARKRAWRVAVSESERRVAIAPVCSVSFLAACWRGCMGV
jgi:hypothetical protein